MPTQRSLGPQLTSTLALVYNGKTRKDMIMKIFALCIGLGFGIFAIAVYAYGLKHRIKELTDKSQNRGVSSNGAKNRNKGPTG